MIGLCVVCLATMASVFQVSASAENQSNAPDKPAAAASGTLAVIDEGGSAHTIAPVDFAQLPQQTVKATSHDKEAEFSGASLVDVLSSCGVEFGEKLKGKRAPTVAILDATDGYRVVISLLEIDPATTDKVAIVANKRDGQPLSAKKGPYRLVLPGEKREIRWIRNLQSIHIVNLKDLPLDKSTTEEIHDGH
jgi:hypothetical protein